MSHITNVFQPQRYTGFWYQIARIPFYWDQDCVGATAEYYMLPNGNIRLVNTCLQEDGSSYTRTGEAQEADDYHNGHLEIRFTDGLPSDTNNEQIPEAIKALLGNQSQAEQRWAPYWVHWTDYVNYSIVGSPDKSYLWILSRCPTIPKEDLYKLTCYIKEMGYDLEKIIIDTDKIN